MLKMEELNEVKVNRKNKLLQKDIMFLLNYMKILKPCV